MAAFNHSIPHHHLDMTQSEVGWWPSWEFMLLSDYWIHPHNHLLSPDKLWQSNLCLTNNTVFFNLVCSLNSLYGPLFSVFRVVPVNGNQVCSWLLGAQRGPKNTLFEWHSSAVNICRFLCSFLLQLSIPLVLILCPNRQAASPTPEQILYFKVVLPVLLFWELLIWKWTMLQSYSKSFVIATKIFNVPSSYADKREANKKL